MRGTSNVNRAIPRLSHIATGLSGAAAIAFGVASCLPTPHSNYDVIASGRWEFAEGMFLYLFLTALAAWAFIVFTAVVRWYSDWPGY